MPIDKKLELGEPKLFDDGFIYIFGLPSKVQFNQGEFYVRKIKFPTLQMLTNEEDTDRVFLERQLLNIVDFQLGELRIRIEFPAIKSKMEIKGIHIMSAKDIRVAGVVE